MMKNDSLPCKLKTSYRYIPVLLIFMLQMLNCMQIFSPELGVLNLALTFDDQGAPMLSSNGDSAIQKGIIRMPGYEASPAANTTDITQIRVTIIPGDLTFSFQYPDSPINMDIDLGIYNITVNALDNQGRCLYQGEAAKILVESLKTTQLTIRMTPLFPCQAPEFIGLSAMNENTTGDYQLQWTSCLFANSYSVEESADNIFSSAKEIYAGADTTCSITGQDEGKWYYRVNGKNDIAQSPWSQTVAFHVQYIPTLEITTDTPASAKKGTFYTDSILVTGGTAPYAWSISSGTLPTGLSLATETGIISGTPTAVDEWTFTVRVTDNSNPQQSAEKSFSINVTPEDLVITTSSIPDGTVDQAYSETLTATGGTTPYTWSISYGTLPAGLSLNASTGVISGTPTAPGTFSFTVQVTDSDSSPQTDTQALSITIFPTTLTITTTSLASRPVGQYYSRNVHATGGTTPYTWSISSGTLPVGLSLDASKGEISGTPTTDGTSNFTVQVTDSDSPPQTDTQALSITIYPADLIITTTSLPNVTAGVFYTKQLQASGGTSPYTWSETPASSAHRAGTGFAEGIYIDANGLLDGTCHDFPTTDQIEFKVTDSSVPQQTSTKTFNLKIKAGALDLYTPTSPMSGKVGTPFSRKIIYRQGTPPLQTPWTFGGSWPVPGLSVSYSDQNYILTISGTPTTAGTYNFTVTIKDNSTPQKTRTDSFSIIINP